MQSFLDRFGGDWAPWIDIAATYAGLGDLANAIDRLERGYEHRCFDALFIPTTTQALHVDWTPLRVADWITLACSTSRLNPRSLMRVSAASARAQGIR